jgi:hypothetical protein
MLAPCYPSDLSDAQWALVSPCIPPAKSGGRPRTTEIRAVFDAILYLLRTGCQWRQLPADFPGTSGRSVCRSPATGTMPIISTIDTPGGRGSASIASGRTPHLTSRKGCRSDIHPFVLRLAQRNNYRRRASEETPRKLPTSRSEGR